MTDFYNSSDYSSIEYYNADYFSLSVPQAIVISYALYNSSDYSSSAYYNADYFDLFPMPQAGNIINVIAGNIYFDGNANFYINNYRSFAIQPVFNLGVDCYINGVRSRFSNLNIGGVADCYISYAKLIFGGLAYEGIGNYSINNIKKSGIALQFDLNADFNPNIFKLLRSTVQNNSSCDVYINGYKYISSTLSNESISYLNILILNNELQTISANCIADCLVNGHLIRSVPIQIESNGSAYIDLKRYIPASDTIIHSVEIILTSIESVNFTVK